MGTFVTGYVIVGLAVAAYVARLARQQRRLQEQLEALQSARRAQEDRDAFRSKAAWEGHGPWS